MPTAKPVSERCNQLQALENPTGESQPFGMASGFSEQKAAAKPTQKGPKQQHPLIGWHAWFPPKLQPADTQLKGTTRHARRHGKANLFSESDASCFRCLFWTINDEMNNDVSAAQSPEKKRQNSKAKAIRWPVHDFRRSNLTKRRCIFPSDFPGHNRPRKRFYKQSFRTERTFVTATFKSLQSEQSKNFI